MKDDFANIETDKSLKKLEKKIAQEYARAYREMDTTARKYFLTLEDRYMEQHKAYERGEYTDREFNLWYKTQMERGKGYKEMRDQLAWRMAEANQVASAYINDKTPSIYSLNYNYEAYRIEGAHPSVRFDIYDEQTVRKLIEGDNAVEFKTVNPNPTRDYNWNKEQITSALTSGILQGKSIDKLADSFLTVMERNRTSAIRNARTAFTSAQNGGRQESYKRARQMGITMQKEWLATMDERTRASHGRLDGERVDTDKPFSNDLMYPADPDGAPSEVYNCRCTMFAVLPDVNDEKRETYSDWISRKQKEMEGKEAKSEKEKELKKAIERWNASHYSKNTLENVVPFIPAKTREEAEAYALRFANNVSYKGISLENANEINKTLTELTDKYPIEKLDHISEARIYKNGVAQANYNELEFNGKKLSEKVLSDAVFEANQEKAKESMKIIEERWQGKKMPESIKRSMRNLEQYTKYNRWGTAENVNDVVRHEFGHLIADQRIAQISEKARSDYKTNRETEELRKLIKQTRSEAIKNGDIYSISKYGSTNEYEFFAETFAMREKGEKVSSYINDMLDKVLKYGQM